MNENVTFLHGDMSRVCIACGKPIKAASRSGEHWVGGEPCYVVKTQKGKGVYIHKSCYEGELRHEAETS